jgi:hypothetical protein
MTGSLCASMNPSENNPRRREEIRLVKRYWEIISNNHLRRAAPRNFFGLRLIFADFAVFRFFVLADFFNTGMEALLPETLHHRNP